ncbi:MAG TPA: condensation domain-containing protein, partial [Burkholderiaceae bacterium]|nr:condensation domain-containing protein [Burkholderiaceae bacterium]
MPSCPLLGSQKGMWLQEQLHPTGPAQLVATCITLRGPLDKAALQVAIDKLVARHENLRVRFIVGSDGPVQQLPAVFDATVREIDLRLSGQAFADALHEEQQAPMDLQAGPLFRATLLVLAPHEHALLFTIHHLIVDHGSTNLLLRDFGALYQAAVTHEPDPLAPLTLTYSSHARAAAQAGVDDAAKAYWAREMAALPAPLMFATGQRIVPTGRRSAGTVVRTLDVTSASGLRRLGGDAGMTPFMVHLALCAVLMQRHT